MAIIQLHGDIDSALATCGMKPLAVPVFGGMLSSLLHVLIVTPVIFYWLRERGLKKEVLK